MRAAKNHLTNKTQRGIKCECGTEDGICTHFKNALKGRMRVCFKIMGGHGSNDEPHLLENQAFCGPSPSYYKIHQGKALESAQKAFM